jgi:hypothetical protein
MKSHVVQTADEFQTTLRKKLKPIGFSVFGRTFSRLNYEGLTEIIHIQTGNSDPPGTKYLPGFTQNMYGLFTINLGIFIPEVERLWNEQPLPKRVRELHCSIRTRLGELSNRRDTWWRLDRSQRMYDEITSLALQFGVPFFERFATRGRILGEFESLERHESFITVPKIVCAMIYLERGNHKRAAGLLEEQAKHALAIDHKGHYEHVKNLAQRLQLLTYWTS